MTYNCLGKRPIGHGLVGTRAAHVSWRAPRDKRAFFLHLRESLASRNTTWERLTPKSLHNGAAFGCAIRVAFGKRWRCVRIM